MLRVQPHSLANPMYSKKYHDFSLVLSRKKYGVSAYTLRPYRNPLVLLQSETMNLANLSCLSINRKKCHDFSLVLCCHSSCHVRFIPFSLSNSSSLETFVLSSLTMNMLFTCCVQLSHILISQIKQSLLKPLQRG